MADRDKDDASFKKEYEKTRRNAKRSEPLQGICEGKSAFNARKAGHHHAIQDERRESRSKLRRENRADNSDSDYDSSSNSSSSSDDISCLGLILGLVLLIGIVFVVIKSIWSSADPLPNSFTSPATTAVTNIQDREIEKKNLEQYWTNEKIWAAEKNWGNFSFR